MRKGKNGFPGGSVVLLAGLLTVVSLLATAQNKPRFWKDVKVGKKSTNKHTIKEPRLSESDVAWKASRVEYLGLFGASGFLGDLGGQNEVGKPFIYDYEPTQTRYAISLGARYFLREYHALRGMLTYARVRGSDALTNYPNRKYRNLNFKSPIFELATVYEFYLLKPNYKHFAGAPTTRVFDGNRFGIYVYGGVGVFAFNPKGERNGEWYSLKPLNTEGQGLPGGPRPYSRLNISFPMGGGLCYLFDRNWKVGLDFGYRWTTTDYLDDASGYYYNNDVIRENNGQLAGYFANPSVALVDVPNADWYTENQPRGGQESNDTYLFFQLSVSKSIGPSVTNRKIKQKKGGKNRSYKNKRIRNKKRKFRMPKLNFKGNKKRKKGKITTF